MNKPTKPISSPGRTEKFPPPLMRFLRSNVGSKSRRRSRASPMFVRKKNTLFETTQEPSSPKVTCIGQVRVRRSKKNHQTTATRHRNHRNRFCRCLIKNIKSLTVWSKWVSFILCGSCRNSRENIQEQQIEDMKPINGGYVSGEETVTNGMISLEHLQQQKQQQEEQDQEHNINQGLVPQSTPKNAFLLTRCRSAPYRSTSLANMFRESMVEKSGEEEEEEEEVGEKIKSLKIEKEDEEEEEEGTCNESDGCEESKEVPLILSRCKSEPARTWEQLLRV